MKRIVIIFFLCKVISFETAIAQNLPSEFKVFCPEYIVNMKGNPKGLQKGQDWQDWAIKKIKDKDFGKNTKTVWVVYSDRKNNTTYVSASASAKVHTTLDYREKLFVADINNGYALVFTDDYTSIYPQINTSAKSKGWIPVENLLLWETCPKNPDQIFQKGLVVHDPSKSNTVEKNPPYLLEPKNNASTNPNQRAKDLDILFIMKTAKVNDSQYFLLSKEMNCKNRERVLYGWLPEDYITTWDQRLALEPTYATAAVNDYKNLNIYPSIFSDVSQAQQFYSCKATHKPIWEYKDFSALRMDAYTMRNPVITNTEDHIFKIATISSLETSKKGTEDNSEQIENLKEALDNINVIFVIDATSSMKKYFKSVVDALSDIMKRDFSSNIKVGVVLYKDYADPDRISYKPVTSDINQIIGFISASEIGSIDKDDYEAMFLGLETGLDLTKMRYNADQSNFMILIGDAGNHRTDNNGQKWQNNVVSLANKMFENNVNFLAYQINNTGAPAYDDFATQVGKLQKELSIKIKTKIKSEDLEFKLKSNQFYSLSRQSSNIELPVYDTYKYAKTGQSETTEGLKKIIIENTVDFQEIITKRIEVLESTNLGLATDQGNLSKTQLQEILRLANWPENQINKYISYLEQGGSTKLLGFTTDKTKNSDYKLFEYVLFFSHDELEDLIQELNKINSPNIISSRKTYQDAVISMGQAMLGQFNETDIREMSMEDLMAQIYGIPVEMQPGSCGIKIDEIVNIDQVKLDNYIKAFKDKLKGLGIIKNNSYKGRFRSNGITYYWIPISEVPGFCE